MSTMQPTPLSSRTLQSDSNHADLCEILDCETISVEWLAGDGSDRAYYRLKPEASSQTYVLMKLCGDDAEALRQGQYDWIALQKTLEGCGIRAPKLIKECPEKECIIIEDYGDLTFESYIKSFKPESNQKQTLEVYNAATDILVEFLKIPRETKDVWTTRAFDQERLVWEIDFFKKHFLTGVLNLELSPKELQCFNDDNVKMNQFLAPFSQYFCHRDFHSRNLMVKDEKLAVIDFQDARLGSPAYDLVSLCFDAYVPLSSAQRIEILEKTIAKVQHSLGQDIADDIEKSWRAVLLQRQLKAIGSFGYLANVKNKPMYLSYVPKALTLLQEAQVQSEDWAFLSGELLERLCEIVHNTKISQGPA